MYVKLSYPITSDAPTYPGNPGALSLEPFTQIKQGDVANQFLITLFNHDGTHLDGPQHFNDHSPVQLSELPISDFIFTRPVVIDLEGKIQEKIFPKDLEPFAERIGGADFLLIRTGYSAFRAGDLRRYTQDYPVFSQELAAYLIQHVDGLRGVGTDCISIGSKKFREDGVKAHQILTGINEAGRYLLILEEVNIPREALAMKTLFVIPLFIEQVDSVPVTVFCEV